MDYSSLEELIELCGDNFHSLSRLETKDAGKGSVVFFVAKGKDTLEFAELTPLEAVANLWLALQEKK